MYKIIFNGDEVMATFETLEEAEKKLEELSQSLIDQTGESPTYGFALRKSKHF
jgi:hypothetical protein